MGCILLAVARQWLFVLLAVIPVILGVLPQVQLYTSTDPPADSVPVVTMTFNMHIGNGDARQIVREVTSRHVALLMLEEVTPEAVIRHQDAGLEKVLPYRIVLPGRGGSGTGLWCVRPLRGIHPLRVYSNRFVSVRTSVPGVTTNLTVAALHVAGPTTDEVGWNRDMRQLLAEFERLANQTGTVIVGGDFNLTLDVRQFRRLLDTGFTDGAEQAGAGFVPTYPANRAYPPLIAIDHVLTRHAVATSAQSVEIADSDHRALVVTVNVSKH